MAEISSIERKNKLIDDPEVQEALKAQLSFKDKIEKKWSVPLGIVCMLLGCLTIYSILFSTGYFIYGQTIKAYVFLFIGILFGYLLMISWNKLNKLN